MMANHRQADYYSSPGAVVPLKEESFPAVPPTSKPRIPRQSVNERITKIRCQLSPPQSQVESSSTSPGGSPEKVNKSARGNAALFKSMIHAPVNMLGNPVTMKSFRPLRTTPHSLSKGSLHSMQQWTGMESDNMFRLGPNVEPIRAENSFCEKLFEFASEHGLGIPDFANFHRYNQKRDEMLYMSRVKVNDWTYSSIPIEHPILSVVQEHAAKNALEGLIEKLAETEDLATLQIANDKLLIIQRVAEIVGEHSNGLKAEFVEAKFRKLFGEKLPHNWMDLIKSYAPQSVENLINGFHIYPLQHTERNILNVGELPALVLPESNVWNIFLTLCISSNIVYFRLVGLEYDAEYSALAERMEMIYGSKESDLTPAPIIVEGHYYAACIENQWFRVKILPSSLSSKQYRTFLVDHGDIEEASADCIFTLYKDFTHLPAQALQCRLTGLEGLHNNDDVTQELQFIAQRRKAYVAEVNSRQPDLKLTLYDTTTNVDINLNEEILHRLSIRISPRMPTLKQNGPNNNVRNLLTHSPSVPPFPLPNVGGWLHVSVSMVLNRGRFVIQPLNYKDELKKMTEDMRNYYTFNKPVANVIEISVGCVFAVEYENKEWRRAMVIDVLEEMGEVSIICVDYGNIFTVHFNMVYHLLPCFRKIPSLAMEAELAGIAPRGSYWSMKDCLYLNELLVNKEFLAEFVKKIDGVVFVKLIYQDLSSASYTDIGAQLIMEGRAIMQPNGVHPYNSIPN